MLRKKAYLKSFMIVLCRFLPLIRCWILGGGNPIHQGCSQSNSHIACWWGCSNPCLMINGSIVIILRSGSVTSLLRSLFLFGDCCKTGCQQGIYTCLEVLLMLMMMLFAFFCSRMCESGNHIFFHVSFPIMCGWPLMHGEGMLSLSIIVG